MGNSYTQKSAKNMTISLGVQIFSNLLGFVSRYVFINCLSAEYLGINGLFANILTILSFAELGIGEALVYAMYKPMKERDEVKLRALLRYYRNSYRWIAAVVLVLGVAISFFIDVFVAQKPIIPENYQVIFCLFVLNNVMSYLMAYKQSILMVDQNKYVVSLVRQAVVVGQVLLQTAFLYFTHQYYIYLFWQIAGTVVINVVLSKYIEKNYPWVKADCECGELPADEKRAIFKDIKALSISKIAGVVSNGLDNIIVAKMISLTTVGIVSNYNMVVNALNGLLWGGLSSITGSIGQFNVNSAVERKRDVFDELFLCTFWLYSFLCVGLMVMLNPLVEVWLGSEYTVDQAVVVALVLIVYVSGVNFPFYSFRVTCGLFEPMKYNYVYFACLNVFLSLLLGKQIGLIGIYAATSISRLIAAEFKEGLIVYKYVLDRYAWQYFLKYGAFAGLFFAVYRITSNVVMCVPLEGWIGFFLKCIICTIIVNGCYMMVFFRTKAFRRLLSKVMALVCRRA